MEVETCGDCWKAVKSLLIFIYAPVISVSLTKKPSTLRIDVSCSLSLSSLPLLPFRCRLFLLFCSCTCGRRIMEKHDHRPVSVNHFNFRKCAIGKDIL